MKKKLLSFALILFMLAGMLPTCGAVSGLNTAKADTGFTVTYTLSDGWVTWSDGSKENKTETVSSGEKPTNVPTGMKPSWIPEGYKANGSWYKRTSTDTSQDKYVANPANVAITGNTTFVYKVGYTRTEETLKKESTVYAGQIFVDGVSQLRYLYSSDLSNHSQVFLNLKNALTGTAFSGLVPTITGETGNKGLAVSSDHQSEMDESWKNIGSVASKYFTGTVGTENNSNLYDTDNTYKKNIDDAYKEIQESIDNMLSFDKRMHTHLTTTTDYVWVNKDGVLVKCYTITAFVELTEVVYIYVNISTALTTATVTYKVTNGTWSDGSTANKTETVAIGSSPASVPTGMKASSGYTGGAWDKDPSSAKITADTTFTFRFTKEEGSQGSEQGQQGGQGEQGSEQGQQGGQSGEQSQQGGQSEQGGEQGQQGGQGEQGGQSEQGGQGGQGQTISDITPAIDLGITKLTLKNAKEQTITAKLANPDDSIASVKSSKDKYAKVSYSGNKITIAPGKKEGKATITVTTKMGAEAKLTVTVKKGWSLSENKITMKKGEKFKIKLSAVPSSIKIKKCESNKPKVAKVDKKGKITAKKKGKATITVTLSNGKKLKLKVIVK